MTPRDPHILAFARMSSTRLPGKTLAPLGDDVVLGYVVRALSQAEHSTGLTITTSADDTDDPIAEWCSQVEWTATGVPLRTSLVVRSRLRKP